ncbi:hypothetical protein Ddc_13548 [Ditylenchus destructor]|nr:hypothetical protein Ddc_13548 [Ditylenchus destructor]
MQAQAFPGYPKKEVITALLNYFIKNTANGFKKIILSVEYGKGNELAKSVFKDKFKFKWDEGDNMIPLKEQPNLITTPEYPTLHIILINGYIDGYMAINVKA